MPSTRSKVRSFLCLPSSKENASSSNLPKEDGQPIRRARPGDRRLSISSTSSISSASASVLPAKDYQSEHRALEQLRALKVRNFKTLKDVALMGAKGEPLDDKSYLMERIIQLAADLPLSSTNSDTLTNSFLSQLWNDLQHPPKSYLGNDFVFRKADGSNNNIMWPHIGATGQPYARSIRPSKMQPIARPDPGMVFDSLLARKRFTPHPSKISSVLFYLASVIIHDIFHTSHTDFSISETSSYLDLAPLYGSTAEQQEQVRTMANGKLKPDCFSDTRILGFPPGVGLLLIFFNRFHNHVVENLAQIDENCRYSSILRPSGRPAPPDAHKQYDEALFQTGRLVTTGLYVNVILKDYVRTILNLNRVDSAWDLDPRSGEGKAIFGTKIPEGLGNQVSAEFNVVYRWHSCISERDEQWTKAAYEKIAGGSSNLSMSDFLRALQTWAAALPADPHERPFADLKRTSEGPEGKYADDDLAAIWVASVNDVAGRFGASHVPEVLRDVEILGIIQARSWNLASLNELRAYFKLKPHETFESINSDPYIAEQLKHLYGHPDNVEIYPGVIVESEKKPTKPGSGLCTNFTTSRAILSDAVSLVRSDRFYTVDYTPRNLTNWGFHAADCDLSVNYGCVFYKLVLNALPHSFRHNSIYAHYPLVIPKENIAILRELKQESFFDFETLAPRPAPVVLSSRHAVQAALTNPSMFSSVWNKNVFLFRTSPIESLEPPSSLARSILDEAEWSSHAKEFYANTLSQLLREKSYRIGKVAQVDIIRDVLTTAHVRFIEALLPLPEQDSSNHDDPHYPARLLPLLRAIFCASYAQPSQAQTGVRMRKDVERLARVVENQIGSIERNNAVESFINRVDRQSADGLRKCGRNATGKLLKANASPDDLSWNQALPLIAASFILLARLSGQCVDYVLNNLDSFLTEIGSLDSGEEARAQDRCERFALKAIQAESAVSIAKVANLATSVHEGDLRFDLSPGQTVICHLNLDVADESGTSVDNTHHDNAADVTMTKMFGPDIHLIYEVNKIAMTALLRSLALLKDLRRAPGRQGQLKKVVDEYGSTMYLNDEESQYLVCPGSMKICWDP